ncbi:unnamed protein product [Ceutorhynchus assimilis]|uniref:Uncharacterized protein n=1 Tax=Ceutorhynchus assimilis TaxID=467358 RepID=A0A9N9MWY3_9CUCU|nr:unnamed protein product [Ceutorhynchus assimilis]
MVFGIKDLLLSATPTTDGNLKKVLGKGQRELNYSTGGDYTKQQRAKANPRATRNPSLSNSRTEQQLNKALTEIMEEEYEIITPALRK